ncbi:MAG TPA: DUF5915 domain-containing protein, partial [Demequina sp.]|nr:DUF5915 domain-containing protein [Demequina sp.]
TGGRSVHLTDYPVAPAAWVDESLGDGMDQVREVVSAVHALRKKVHIRVRQPLSLLRAFVLRPELSYGYGALIMSELNVKKAEVFSVDDEEALQYGISLQLIVNARALGPRIGKEVQTVIKASKSGDWSEVDGVVTAGGIALEEGEYELRLTSNNDANSDGALAVDVFGNGAFIVLDTALTPELEAEGYARDLIRSIQDKRKAEGLNVGDRIVLTLAVPAERVAAVESHRDLISGEVLATSVEVTVGDGAIGLART